MIDGPGPGRATAAGSPKGNLQMCDRGIGVLGEGGGWWGRGRRGGRRVVGGGLGGAHGVGCGGVVGRAAAGGGGVGAREPSRSVRLVCPHPGVGGFVPTGGRSAGPSRRNALVCRAGAVRSGAWEAEAGVRCWGRRGGWRWGGEGEGCAGVGARWGGEGGGASGCGCGARWGGQTTLTVAGYDSRQVAASGGWNRGRREAVYMHRTVESEHPRPPTSASIRASEEQPRGCHEPALSRNGRFPSGLTEPRR